MKGSKTTDFFEGQRVLVLDPDENDLWNHSFSGRVLSVHEDFVRIVDGDDDVWDVDFSKVKKDEQD